MSATLIGTTGNWGIDADQTGMIIDSTDFDYSDEEVLVEDRVGILLS